MALNFPVSPDSLNLMLPMLSPQYNTPQNGSRPYPKHPLDPNDPNYDPKLDPHNPQYDPNDPRLVGGTYTGPRSPQGVIAAPISGPQPPSQAPQMGNRPSDQQPSIPIQSPQGAPQRLQGAPNSPPLIGGAPNMALTNGSGYPMGGLPTQ